MSRTSLGVFSLGLGLGLLALASVSLIVCGYRLDERGESAYEPETYLLWASLFSGLGISTAAALVLTGHPGSGRTRRATPS
jgi:hypothetical protein